MDDAPLPADSPESDTPPHAGPAGVLKLLGLLAVGFVIGRATAPKAAPPAPIDTADRLVETPVDVAPLEEPAVELTGDALLQQQLVGQWTAQSNGTQVCTLNADGTGTNHADLDWMAALIYGSQIDFVIEWTVEDGHLLQELVGGTPEDMVAKIEKDFGRFKKYRVEEMSENRAVLVDTADEDAVEWTRVK